MMIPSWWPLADLAIKTSILFALAAATAALLRRASASTRHFVWSLAFASALALPLLSTVVPALPVPLVSIARDAAPSAAAPASRTEAERQAPAFSDARSGRSADASPHQAPVLQPATPAHASLVDSLPAVTDWPRLILLLWAAGAAVVLGRLALGMAAVQWLSRRTERVTDAAWLPVANELAASLGIAGPVTYLRSPRATMPMAWGLTRPTVLMPADADRWPLERLRIVLLHELAHVQRRDCLTHVVAQVACALHWYNPLAWMASRRARAEREHACDDIVLAAGTDGPNYAEELIEMARAVRAGRFPAVALGATLAMAHRSQLEGRLMAILDPRISRRGMTRVRVAAGTALMLSALVPLAGMQPWTDAPVAVVSARGMDVQDPRILVSPKLPPPADHTSGPHAAAHAARAHATAASARQISSSQASAAEAEVERESDPVHEWTTGLTALAAGTLPAAVSVALADVFDSASVKAVVQVAGQTAAPKPAPAPEAKPVVAGDDERRRNADPRVVAALTAALQDSDRQVRETAMNALVQLRVPEAYDPIVKALSDEAADIRERAAFGLGQLGDKRAVEPLMGALKDTAAGVREQAAFALGQLRDARAIDALAAALKDTAMDVREQAAFALGQIRDRRATQALAAAIADESADVREQAVFALGQLRDASAIDGLTTALRDSKPDVREQAAFALGQIRDAKAVAPLTSALKDTSEDVRQQAAFALGQIHDRAAVEALVIALKDSSEDVREQAAFALGQLRDARAIEALTALLKDTSKDVRQQAAFALGQIAR